MPSTLAYPYFCLFCSRVCFRSWACRFFSSFERLALMSFSFSTVWMTSVKSMASGLSGLPSIPRALVKSWKKFLMKVGSLT